jgi:hypothetical protein
VLHAAVVALAPTVPPLGDAARTRVRGDVAAFVTAQIAHMPVALRLPYRVALAAFNFLAVLRYRRSFCHIEPVAQADWLDRWSERYGFLARNFVKLLRTCTLFAYFDHPLVVDGFAELVSPGRASDARVGGAAD